jgi:hypothetical protein
VFAGSGFNEAINLLESDVNLAWGGVKFGDYAQAWLDDEMHPHFGANGRRYRVETRFEPVSASSVSGAVNPNSFPNSFHPFQLVSGRL